MRGIIGTIAATVVALLLASPVLATPPDAVALFGDSLSSKPTNWLYLYAQARVDAGDPVGITSRSYVGAAFSDSVHPEEHWLAAPLADIDCSQPLASVIPAWRCTVVVMLGTNDLFNGASPIVVLGRLSGFLGKVVYEMPSVGHIVLVIEPTNTGADPTLGATYAEREALAGYLREVCGAMVGMTDPTVSCADLSHAFPEGSPIHPGAAGDQLMADLIGPVLDAGP